jgi:hypothetical protein
MDPITYDFYKNTYGGTAKEDNAFNVAVTKANNLLNVRTFSQKVPDTMGNSVNMAQCELIDWILTNGDYYKGTSVDNGSVQSESDSGYTITYKTDSTSSSTESSDPLKLVIDRIVEAWLLSPVNLTI